MNRGALIASLLLSNVLANVALAEGRVVWTGERSPWVELLRAELSVLDVEVVSTESVPATDAAILELLASEHALALVVSGEPAVLFLPACAGGLEATRIPTLPSPGRSTVLISELLWAHGRSTCPQPPAERAPIALPRPPVELADSPASLSSPLHREPARTPELDVPENVDAPPNQRRRDVLGPMLRVELLHGRDDWTGPFDFAVGGGWRVHPHLGLVVRGSFSRSARTQAPIDRTLVASASTGVQVGIPLGAWRLEVEGGPTILWMRADFEPNLGHDAQRRTFGAYFFGSSLTMPVAERIGLRVLARVTNTGRRNDLTLIGRDMGRWGPIVQLGLGVDVSL